MDDNTKTLAKTEGRPKQTAASAPPSQIVMRQRNLAMLIIGLLVVGALGGFFFSFVAIQSSLPLCPQTLISHGGNTSAVIEVPNLANGRYCKLILYAPGTNISVRVQFNITPSGS